MKRIFLALVAFAALIGSANAIDARALLADEVASCTGGPKTGDPS